MLFKSYRRCRVRRSHTNGFTLIELMIAIAIAGILAALAYPSFADHMNRVRRTDGHTALYDLAVHMEHYFTENSSYAGATTPAIVGASATSSEGHYTLSIGNLSASTYTLSAVPTGAQANDSCGTLTLTQANLKSPSNCW